MKDQFVQDLFGLLPPALAAEAKIQFCGPTGTDAVEAALKLVRTATGRSTILSFQGGYHGMSQGALGLMGNLGPKKPLGAVLSTGEMCIRDRCSARRSPMAAAWAARSCSFR